MKGESWVVRNGLSATKRQIHAGAAIIECVVFTGCRFAHITLGRRWAAETGEIDDRRSMIAEVSNHQSSIIYSGSAGPIGATHITVQSIAGLVARAVNRGRLDEMIWIDTAKATYRPWYRRLLDRHVKVVSNDELLWRIRLGARSSGNPRGEKD